MSSIPRSQKVSICKLVNGLWNTNVQNNKYYGSSDNCPFCSSSETLTHVFTCPSIKATTHRQEALKELELKLTKIKMPAKILSAITLGTVQWVQTTNNQLSTYTGPPKGSLQGVEILVTQALQEQHSDIGWLQLIQGKLSQHWLRAYKITLPKSQETSKRALLWGKRLVLAIWSMAKSIWEHRNREIHGHSIQEARLKRAQKLETQARHLYAKYNENPFLILRRDSHLFNADINEHLLLPMENQAAWLRSVEEAIQVRKKHDDYAANSRRDWFRSFFKVKHPSSCSSSPFPPKTEATLTNQSNKRSGQKNLQPRLTRTMHRIANNNATLSVCRNKGHSGLIRVKGRRRLFKFRAKPLTQNKQVPPQHNQVTTLSQSISSPMGTPESQCQQDSSLTSDDDPLLLHPSGLWMPKSDKIKGSRSSRKHRQIPKVSVRKKPQDSFHLSRDKQKVPAAIPPKGRLEFFGFRAITPKEGNLVQISTLVAEAELNKYSGTYVSTVP